MTVWGAFLGGIISFVSPCVLPLVPPYLCFLAGVSFDELTDDSKVPVARVFRTALAFVLGFTTVFVALGATASLIGQTLTQYLGVLSIIAGAIIALMGLHFLGVFRMSWLYADARVEVQRKPPGVIGGYVVGLAFAFGWTPCVGPVLAAILFMAGAKETAWQGAGLLFAYSLGIGLPFLLAALFAGPFIKLMKRMRAHLGLVEKVMGALLVVTGVLFMTGQMSNMAYWMLKIFPALGTIG
ncbi:MAG TPA: cytochrome c biogenesis protein CcdA [Hyphomicrobiaceae bacterium]|nr:cytochrome c biogenesis protein CcdA [Hyphomicrobiaceae bacterium]